MNARSHLIVALDLPDRSSALAAVDRLAGHVECFKVGLELFVSEGPRLVEELRGRGFSVFLDLKLHDIPNTVAGAVKSACRLNVQMLTVHASGGIKMLEAARQAAEASPERPLLLAVTALTSLAPADLARIGLLEPPELWVERLAGMVLSAGIPGLVASSLELFRLRATFGTQLKYVIPGIRHSGGTALDQSRTAPPGEAIRNGADFIVVGRPILHDPDPVAAAERIVAEIESALIGQPVS